MLYMLVHRRMTRDVVTVPSTATVADALDILNAHTIRHLPVVDDGKVVGILSDRDLRKAMTGRPDETIVGDVLTADPVTVAPHEPVDTAAQLLVEHDVGCVPVVENGNLVGIVTASDLLRSYVDLMAGREKYTRIELLAPDRPGELARVVRLIGVEHGVNLTGVAVPPPQDGHARVVLHLECDDAAEILEDLQRLGYDAGSPALAPGSDTGPE
jgi:acetoin utilization protein AcuB